MPFLTEYFTSFRGTYEQWYQHIQTCKNRFAHFPFRVHIPLKLFIASFLLFGSGITAYILRSHWVPFFRDRIVEEVTTEMVALSPAPAVAADLTTLQNQVEQLVTQVGGMSAQLQQSANHEKELSDQFNQTVTILNEQRDAFNQKGAALDAALAKVQSQSSAGGGSQSTASPTPQASASPSTASGKVNVNTAVLSELETLPGIGATYAQRILDYRTAHGPFSKVEDLDAVSGIGSATIERLRDLVTF